jgi:hypothetical protein
MILRLCYCSYRINNSFRIAKLGLKKRNSNSSRLLLDRFLNNSHHLQMSTNHLRRIALTITISLKIHLLVRVELLLLDLNSKDMGNSVRLVLVVVL